MRNYRPFFVCLLLLNCAVVFSQVNNPNRLPFDWKTDLSKTDIDLSEVTVVVQKGAFPVLKNPKFIDRQKGLLTFISNEPVLVVNLSGEARAYPLNMLTIHEIANDQISDIKFLVTYCPLCNSGMVFDRNVAIDDQTLTLDFEVSGMLRNSDMIMFDKQTETWWQQLTGEGIAGKLNGVELKVIPSVVLSVADFFERYPQGKILSKEGNGVNSKSYGQNPYVGYDALNGNPYGGFIKPEKLTRKLPNMERIVGLRINQKQLIYPFTELKKKKIVNDEFEGQKIVVFFKSGTVSVLDTYKISEGKDVGTAVIYKPIIEGQTLTFKEKKGYFYDVQTNSKWDITGKCLSGKHEGKQLEIEPHGIHLAFAWLAFYPNSEIYFE